MKINVAGSCMQYVHTHTYTYRYINISTQPMNNQTDRRNIYGDGNVLRIILYTVELLSG